MGNSFTHTEGGVCVCVCGSLPHTQEEHSMFSEKKGPENLENQAGKHGRNPGFQVGHVFRLPGFQESEIVNLMFSGLISWFFLPDFMEIRYLQPNPLSTMKHHVFRL